MFEHLAVATADKTLQQSSNVIKQISTNLFAGNSLWVLIVSLIAAGVAGKLCSIILRQVSRTWGKRADAASDLETVDRYRRLETWTILSIAITRLLLFILGIYFWWSYTHPDNRPSALIGASALLIVVIGGVFSPLLRDFAFGSGMMAEHWFGVGDLITIEPFTGIQGVVERITLRSTRIRGLNGEVIWMSNQNIAGVRIAQKGVWTMALELFVTDAKRAEALIEQTNALLPTGPSLLARELSIMTVNQRGDDLWHITAIGETAPGRQWLLEKTAVDLLQKLDEKSKHPVLLSEPVARYADNETERQFARAVRNAKKTRRTPRRPKLPASVAAVSKARRGGKSVSS
jgi:hypothetical protein